MRSSDITSYIVPVLTVFGSFVGAWLAARFALGRFFQEKLWERKTVAYTAIFEALYDMSVWFDVHFDAELTHRDLPKDEQALLREEYKKARSTLARRLAAEVWLIPDPCRERIEQMFATLDKRKESWFEQLDHGSYEITEATKDLTWMVRLDLGVRVLPKGPTFAERVWGNRADRL